MKMEIKNSTTTLLASVRFQSEYASLLDVKNMSVNVICIASVVIIIVFFSLGKGLRVIYSI